MTEHTSPWVLENSTDPRRPEDVDWPERQAEAWIPYQVLNGRPLCPDRLSLVLSDIVQFGRNGMRLWGENKMADALVTATFRGVRYVLLIERDDPRGDWAMPGGAVEPGESAIEAACRECAEETGFALAARLEPITLDEPRWVPDPRGSMEAWAVTIVARCDLGEVDALPEVRGGDDARDAMWCPIGGPIENIFPAHREILGAPR